ncbi:MAG: DUF2235 domain-containing protein [Bacteroidota bacterium]
MRNSFRPDFKTRTRAMARKLLFCFDGTWNDPSDAYEKGSDITNVLKTYRAAVEDGEQKTFYYEGVGTGNELDKLLGGATGKGADRIRNEAFIDLVHNYKPGDQIFITGFSRGAAIARMFAQLIHQEGIPEELRFSGKKRKFKTKGEVLSRPNVELMGIYDTVASFGLPSDIAGIPFQQINLFKNFDIARTTQKVIHLVAVHEGRNTFKPTLCNYREGVEEIWFPGVHADVGGGYTDSGISDIALDYMLKNFQEKGLKFQTEKLKEIKPNITGNIHDKVKEDYPLKLVHRDIEVWVKGKASPHPPKVHESVWNRLERFGERTPLHLEKVKSTYTAISSPKERTMNQLG